MSTLRLLVGFLLFCSFAERAAANADALTGTVRNATTGKPASGDEVILLRLENGMQEESRTRADSRGTFSFTALDPTKSYLVRVIHQGVNYDQSTSSNAALAIDVFDAEPRVNGIAGSIEILRTAAHGKFLHVTDMIEIRNDSKPPVTRSGGHTFEVFLDAQAKVDSVMAAGPGNIAVLIRATPAAGDPGHYMVNFPLRPGATKFAFNYDLPYDGHAAFQTKHAYPLQQFVVMIPPGVKFSSPSPDFQLLETGNSNYQVQAVNGLKAGDGPVFEISGKGLISPLISQAKPTGRPQWPYLPYASLTAPLGILEPSTPRANPPAAQLSSPLQSVILYSLSAVLLAGCAFLILRARKPVASAGAET